MMKRFIPICLAMFMTAACVEPIDLDPGDEQRPVIVNCAINTGKSIAHSMTLQYAKGKHEEEFLPVEDAVVYIEAIKNGKAERIMEFHHKEGCIWESEAVEIEPNKKHVLHVEIPGREAITAETVSTPSRISFGWEDGEFARELIIETKPGFLQNCAMWITASEITGPNKEKTDLEYIATNHPGADGISLTGKKFSELSFQGESDIPEIIDFKNEYNRAKGFLSEYPLYEKFIRIGQPENPSPFFIYAGQMTIPYPYDLNGMISLCAQLNISLLSKDLDKYLRSAIIHHKSLETDLTSVYATIDSIYSNIEGGYGVFGFYVSNNNIEPFIRDYYSWDLDPHPY